MGKIKTCISKGDIQTRVYNDELDAYLKDGWIKGWPKMQEHMKKMSEVANLRKKQWKEDDPSKYDNYIKNKNKKTSDGLKKFWKSVDEEYIKNRENKKVITRDGWTEEQRESYHKKMSESAKKNRQTITQEEYSKRAEKGHATRKKNKTTNTSSSEDAAYLVLLRYFPDVIRWYIDVNRYPYECDFYIPSIDCFVECNYHYTHGPHPFNPNSQHDIALLEKIRKKQKLLKNGKKNSYCVYEDVWTKRDVEKIKVAKENGLKYYAVYSEEEFQKVVQEVLNEIR